MSCPNFADFYVSVGVLEPLRPLSTGERSTAERKELTVEQALEGAFIGAVNNRFPPDHGDCSLPDNIWMFCLPDGVKFSRRQNAPCFFPFVLTELNGVHMFGAALTFYEPYLGPETALRSLYVSRTIAIVSHHAFFSFYRDYLCEIYRAHFDDNRTKRVPIERYLQNLIYQVPLPPPGKVEIAVSVGGATFYSCRAPVNDFPTCDISIVQLFECFDVSNVVTLFHCALLEQQIVFLGSQYTLLTAVCEALKALLFPLRWDHVYIPVLPRALFNFVHAPMPFIMGLCRPDNAAEIPSTVVIADIDKNTVRLGSDPMPALPEYVKKKLLKRLSTAAEGGSCRKASDRALPNHLVYIDDAFPISAPYAPINVFSRAELIRSGGKVERLFPENERVVTTSRLIVPSSDHTPPQEKHAEQNRNIRTSFLRFFVSILKGYDNFMLPETDGSAENEMPPLFDADGFMNQQWGDIPGRENDSKDFLAVFLKTQAFNIFTEECANRIATGDMEFKQLFFNENIDAKNNKSVWKISKKVTPFLVDRTYKISETYRCPEPDLSRLEEMRDNGEPRTVFPHLILDNFTLNRQGTEPLSARVIQLLEEYTKRIEEDIDFHKERMDEQRLNDELTTIDWTPYNVYNAPDLRVPEKPRLTYLVSEMPEDDVAVHWIEIQNSTTKQEYYYNLLTRHVQVTPPDYFVSRADAVNLYNAQVVLRGEQSRAREAMMEKQRREQDALQEEYAQKQLAQQQQHAAEWRAMLDSQKRARKGEYSTTIQLRKTTLEDVRSNVAQCYEEKEKRKAELHRRMSEARSTVMKARRQEKLTVLASMQQASAKFGWRRNKGMTISEQPGNNAFTSPRNRGAAGSVLIMPPTASGSGHSRAGSGSGLPAASDMPMGSPRNSQPAAVAGSPSKNPPPAASPAPPSTDSGDASPVTKPSAIGVSNVGTAPASANGGSQQTAAPAPATTTTATATTTAASEPAAGAAPMPPVRSSSFVTPADSGSRSSGDRSGSLSDSESTTSGTPGTTPAMQAASADAVSEPTTPAAAEGKPLDGAPPPAVAVAVAPESSSAEKTEVPIASVAPRPASTSDIARTTSMEMFPGVNMAILTRARKNSNNLLATPTSGHEETVRRASFSSLSGMSTPESLQNGFPVPSPSPGVPLAFPELTSGGTPRVGYGSPAVPARAAEDELAISDADDKSPRRQ